MRPGEFAPPLTTIKPKWRNWQTRMVQVHVPARVWGFKSLLRHQASSIFTAIPLLQKPLRGFAPAADTIRNADAMIGIACQSKTRQLGLQCFNLLNQF